MPGAVPVFEVGEEQIVGTSARKPVSRRPPPDTFNRTDGRCASR